MLIYGKDMTITSPYGISFSLCLSKTPEENAVQVLFIGNSFTYFNDMPFTFLNMAKTLEPDSRVESIAYGGYSLAQYADEETEVGKLVISKIVSYEWDYVVLQEQSLIPCISPDDFVKSVKKLAGIISQIGAKIVLYETWAYEDGSQKLGETNMTYDEMSKKLKDAYEKAAEEANAVIAPVGDIFSYVNHSEHIVNLLNRNDQYHPSTSGSYLAACVIFRTITGKSTIGLPCPSNVSLYNLSVVQKLTDTII